jgi:D-glycero-D-manno-heptose 1,7-bisphosphate phosphatase
MSGSQARIQRAIFLDRDGVINDNSRSYYVWRKEDLVLNPGVPETLRSLKEQGYLLIVVSNQGGISKELYTKEDVFAFHEAINRELKPHHAAIDAFYFCPHHDEVENCLCRKPRPLLIQRAMARFIISPEGSWFVGDSPRDAQAGRAAGLSVLEVEANGDLRKILEKL